MRVKGRKGDKREGRRRKRKGEKEGRKEESFLPLMITDDFFEEEDDVKRYRDRLPSATLDEQIEYLEEKLEIVQSQYTGYTLKRKEKNLRQQLYAVRRQLRQQRPRNSGWYIVWCTSFSQHSLFHSLSLWFVTLYCALTSSKISRLYNFINQES